MVLPASILKFLSDSLSYEALHCYTRCPLLCDPNDRNARPRKRLRRLCMGQVYPLPPSVTRVVINNDPRRGQDARIEEHSSRVLASPTASGVSALPSTTSGTSQSSGDSGTSLTSGGGECLVLRRSGGQYTDYLNFLPAESRKPCNQIGQSCNIFDDVCCSDGFCLPVGIVVGVCTKRP